jgi:hypothetical protein
VVNGRNILIKNHQRAFTSRHAAGAPAAVALSRAPSSGTDEPGNPPAHHGWDLARAIGQHTDLDPGLAAALLSQARLAITDVYRGPDGQALFGPAAAAPAGAGPADRLAAFLGLPAMRRRGAHRHR